MIACVSPGKSSADQTLNTLRYAERLKDGSGSSNVCQKYMRKAPKESSDDSKLNFYQSDDMGMEEDDEPDYSALDAAVEKEEAFNNTSPVFGDEPLFDSENNLLVDGFDDENMIDADTEIIVEEQDYTPEMDQEVRKPLKNNFNNKPDKPRFGKMKSTPLQKPSGIPKFARPKTSNPPSNGKFGFNSKKVDKTPKPQKIKSKNVPKKVQGRGN